MIKKRWFFRVRGYQSEKNKWESRDWFSVYRWGKKELIYTTKMRMHDLKQQMRRKETKRQMPKGAFRPFI